MPNVSRAVRELLLISFQELSMIKTDGWLMQKPDEAGPDSQRHGSPYARDSENHCLGGREGSSLRLNSSSSVQRLLMDDRQ